MKQKVRLFSLLALFVSSLTMFACSDKDNELSGTEKMLVGKWQRFDSYFAQYYSGWCDELTLRNDHTSTFKCWGDAWGEHVTTTNGTWSYDAGTNKLTWSADGYNYREYVYSISDIDMELVSEDGDLNYWRKI